MKFLSDRALDRLRAGAAAPDLTGTGYRLIGAVARGGMGVVYAAEDVQLERRVALKVLDLPDASGTLTERLVREARVLARLEHPGIVPVHDVGRLADGRVYYTMKFVEGRRLDGHMKGVDSVPDRLRIFLRICEAVAFAHARGVLHRDLKPTNVMVGPFGEVLVMDWGLAKLLREAGEAADQGETLIADAGAPDASRAGRATPVAEPPTEADEAQTAHGAVLGTPGYMAPEQERGDVASLDERADIYSLGAILRFLLTRQQPAESIAAPTGVPRQLAAVCAKAMAQDPAARYTAVEELSADVSRYLDGLPVRAYPERLRDKLERLYARHHVAILLIVAYLTLRVVLLFLTRR